MTFPKSLNNSFFNLYRFTISKNIPIIIVASILSFLILPLHSLTQENPIDLTKLLGDPFTELYSRLLIVFLIYISTSVILTIMNLNYMHSKKASDMFMALPLKRSSVYLARILATITGAVIPLFCSVIPTIILSLFTKTSFMGYHYLLRCVLMMIITNISLTFIGGFFMTITGHTFDAGISFLTFCGGLPILVSVALLYATNLLYGYTNELINTNIILGFSPVLSFAAYAIRCLGNTPPSSTIDFTNQYSYKYYDLNYNYNPYTILFIIWIVLAIAIFVVTLLLIKRRKTETAGTPYSFKFAPILVESLICVLAAFLLGELFTNFRSDFNFTYIFYAFLGSLIAATIVGAVINRGFKKTVNSLIVGAVCASIALSYGLILKYDVFNFVSFVPSVDEVSSVTVYYSENGTNYGMATSTFTKPDSIKMITEAHKSIVENKNIEDDTLRSTTLSLKYSLKNGKWLERDYNINNSASDNELNKIYKDSDFLNNAVIISDGFVSIYNNYYLVDKDKESSEYKSVPVITLTKQEAEELFKAYLKDIHSGAEESLSGIGRIDLSFKNTAEMCDSKTNRLEFKFVYGRNSMYINKMYKNTLSYLEEKGVNTNELVYE